MTVILAVNEKSIEEYISKLPDVNVLKIIRNNKTLFQDVIELNPHLVIISNQLAGKERIEDILTRLREEQPQTRIAYIYGKDDIVRKAFQAFLYKIGVYDFHYNKVDSLGNTIPLRKEDIDKLLFNPVKKEDVPSGELTILEEKYVNEQLEKKAQEKQRIREQLTREYASSKYKDDPELKEEIEEEIEQKVVSAVEKEIVVEIIERVEEKEVVKIQTNTVVETKFIKKQTIAVLSIFSPKRKDDFITNIAHLLAQKTDQKVLVIDFESPFPTLDHRFNTDIYIDVEEIYNAEELTGVSACLSALKKNLLNANTIPQYVSKIKGYKNLYLLTGLNALNKFEDTSKEDIYSIIEYAEQAFDTVILSLNSFILNGFSYCGISKANKVIFVSECDYTDARAELSYIKEYITNFKIDSNNFYIVPFGTIQSTDTISSLYREYNILGYIKDNPKYKIAAHKRVVYLDKMANKEDIKAYTNILIKMGFLPKENFLNRIPILNKIAK